MDKYLIINADDFGMCRSANLAVMDLLKSGSITSSTIMAPCAWASDLHERMGYISLGSRRRKQHRQPA